MSFMGVIGSKASVSQDLIERMPPEAFGSCYIELFAGGAAVFFAKNPARINVLNDADPDLALVYEAIQRDVEAVQLEMSALLDDDRTFRKIHHLRDSEEWPHLPLPRRAAWVIYLHKATVNSNQVALSNSSKTMSSFNPDFDLSAFAHKLKRAQLRSFPWARCLETYLSHSEEVEAFVFADPPYVVCDTALYYRINFHAVEHIRFWYKMTQLSKNNGPKRNVKIMITYDDDPLIRALYREEDGWRIDPLPIAYRSANDPEQCRDEIAIYNYAPPCPTSPLTGAERAATADRIWDDLPETAVGIDGVPVESLDCCDKERIALVGKGRRKGKCRVCEKAVVIARR